MDSPRCDLPEGVIPRYQVGQCQYGSITGNLLLPQGTLQLFPVVADNFIIISAFCFSNGGKHTHTRSWKTLLHRFQMVSPYFCPGPSGQRYFWSKSRISVMLRHPNCNKSVLPGANTTWICLNELLKNSSAGQDHWRCSVSNLTCLKFSQEPSNFDWQ